MKLFSKYEITTKLISCRGRDNSKGRDMNPTLEDLRKVGTKMTIVMIVEYQFSRLYNEEKKQ